MEALLQPLILAGGVGRRLWPVSTPAHPKQFLSLCGDKTMLQETVARLEGLGAGAPVVICAEAHRFVAAEQLRAAGIAARVMLEPFGRNTAPAIVLSALSARASGDDPVLLVLAADHAIGDAEAFRAAVQVALPLAEAGRLVTFGIVPTRAETGYGYIRRGAARAEGGYDVAAFVEKPDRSRAEGYLADGGYLWNSGMFVFKASALLDEIAQHRPDILAACEATLAASGEDADFFRIDAASFAECPACSIDYAVMEKTELAAVVPLDAGWSDIGSFAALWDLREKDEGGNVLSGSVMAEACSDCLIQSHDRPIVGIGLEGLVVVETGEGLLVAVKDKVQEVEKVVRRLNEAG